LSAVRLYDISYSLPTLTVPAVWCNQSGGSAIGSLGAGTAISTVLYRNIYTNGGNQAMMIKSNGGSGYARDMTFESFVVRGSAYGLDINQYWSSMAAVAGNGVQLSNIAFRDWNGNVVRITSELQGALD
jgi:rhamnogalacturonan hydrolase